MRAVVRATSRGVNTMNERSSTVERDRPLSKYIPGKLSVLLLHFLLRLWGLDGSVRASSGVMPWTYMRALHNAVYGLLVH